MKSRFSSIDVFAILPELRAKFVGLRVANVYDVDGKTYLLKMGGSETKAVLLLESGIRIHSTVFDYPKSMMPSGFSMKLRKHICGRRLESLTQIAMHRIVDLQFGSGEAAYHIILELYDRGNIVLTDFSYTILNILRRRTDKENDVRLAVRNVYPLEASRTDSRNTVELDRLKEVLPDISEGEQLKRALSRYFVYGTSLVEHGLLKVNLPRNCKKGNGFNIENDIPRLLEALQFADDLFKSIGTSPAKGYIVINKLKKLEEVNASSTEAEYFIAYEEFHPVSLAQFEGRCRCFTSFDSTVDEYFSRIEGQKIDTKTLHMENQAMKRLENIREDHLQRVTALKQAQNADVRKAMLIEMNAPLVKGILHLMQTLIATQISWEGIDEYLQELRSNDHPMGLTIKALNLAANQITLTLCANEVDEDETECFQKEAMDVVLNIGLSAYANARTFYDHKRGAAEKEQKTLDSSSHALKVAEKKVRQDIKELEKVATIRKSRKIYWFEKFLFSISSEGYLILGGRDQQQNEVLVKRYLRQGDIYVHADLHGSTSIIVKNPSGNPIPPKTLLDAGTMAVSHSGAWESKTTTSAWWVYHHQVSKTAPSGEYLTTGSFMIRGKKNFLPACYLVFGFGLLFKLSDESCENRKTSGWHQDESLQQEEEEICNGDTIAKLTIETLPEDRMIEEEGHKDRLVDDVMNEESTIVDEVDELERLNGHKIVSDINDSQLEVEEEILDSDTDDVLQSEGFSDTGDNNVNSDTKSPNDASDGIPDELEEEVKPIPSHIEEGDALNMTIASLADPSLSGNNSFDVEKTTNTKDFDYPNTDLGIHSRHILRSPKTSISSKKQTNSKHKPAAATPVVASDAKPKRGKHLKNKKIKQKYQDQDEEERELKMKLLAAAGAPKEKRRKGKAVVEKNVMKSRRVPQAITTLYTDELAEPQEDDSGMKMTVEDVVQSSEDAKLLTTLEKNPREGDQLLFVLPVCAPYASLAGYKYRVKLLPGNTKKGKALKTALAAFMSSKGISSREKDLMKSLKDVDISRNLPGKVSISLTGNTRK